MKKILGLMLLCVMGLGFVSCENEGGGSFYATQIIGTWETTQGFIGGEWIDIPTFSDMYATMTFNEDGSYYGDSELFGSGWGTYTLSGATLNTYYDGR